MVCLCPHRKHPAWCPPLPQPGSHPSWLAWLVRRLQEWRGQLNNCHPFVGNLSLTTSAPLHTFILFSARCALCHCLFHLTTPLSHSHSPTSIKYLSPIALSFLLAAFSSMVNSFSSAQPTLFPFADSSPRSLTPPRLLLFIYYALPFPLSSSLILARSVFIQLCSLSQFGWTRLIASLPLTFASVPSTLSLRLHTDHLYLLSTERLGIITLSTCAFCLSQQPLSNVPKKCHCKHKLVELHFLESAWILKARLWDSFNCFSSPVLALSLF